ncbi:hypothetical protein RIF29_43183 [Crotalaria pallida]|uniref:Uncharacterized protein n=1 Tax=Crotalaria pallida TaxID=3830 RepID=A0AAN9DWY2_CROPI
MLSFLSFFVFNKLSFTSFIYIYKSIIYSRVFLFAIANLNEEKKSCLKKYQLLRFEAITLLFDEYTKEHFA